MQSFASSMTLPGARFASCSRSYRSSCLPGVGLRGRSRRLTVRAQESEQPQTQEPQEGDRESMLEALEAQARARKGAKAAQVEALRPPVSQRASSSQGGKVVWKEGQLFPEGWEEMDLPTKMYQLYTGERGFMFWANKAALASIVIIIVGWAAFRFLGPALGLYELQSDFMQPNYL